MAIPTAPLRPAILASFVVGVGCATLAGAGGGDTDLPNANAGPFRVLRTGEIAKHAAPYIANDDRENFRDPSAVDADGDPSTLGVFVYAVAGPDASSRIVGFHAEDGRSVPLTPDDVLAATLDWEAGAVGDPSALAMGSEIWLYYGAAGGIGLATSADGHSFQKSATPVLDAQGAPSWEGASVPSQPTVVRLPGGSLRLFYAAAGSIGEATSTDGRAWTRIGDGPALSPTAAPGAPVGDGGGDEPFDDAAVEHPFAMTATSGNGRPILRLYYGGLATSGARALGLAARYGYDGPFERAVTPVLSNALLPRAPSVVAFSTFSLLYFTERAGSTNALSYPAIAVGVAPANLELPEPVAP